MFPLGPSRSVIDPQMQGHLWCLACGRTQGRLPQESHDPSEGLGDGVEGSMGLETASDPKQSLLDTFKRFHKHPETGRRIVSRVSECL